MYAWAKDAPPTHLPPDVAFKIAPDEVLVMQIHYANQFSEPDHTSVTVRLDSKKPKYFAGIYLLWSMYLPIPPGKSQVKGDMSCISTIDPPLHIFAFRPHAHSLGRRIIGIKKDGQSQQSQIIANGDPQKPQAFYPLDQEVVVEKGDTLFARCIYDSTKQSKMTYIGPTAGDEMCNLYLMYYSLNDQHDFFDCSRMDDHKLTRVADQLMLEKEPKSLPILTSPTQALNGYKFNFDNADQVGDICGLTYDVYGNIVILTRGNHRWGPTTFNWNNEYQGNQNEPINVATVYTLNSTGHVLSSWGQDKFFLPHMITIDAENNVWITDVAMHQVFKFGPYGGRNGQALVELGKKFKPGKDDLHYCKPTSVAVESDARTFYVSDGYCNQRIIKYAIRSINANGYHSVVKIMSFGAEQVPTGSMPMPYDFHVPHALALVESQGMICVADRENGLVQCFKNDDGKHEMTIELPKNMDKVYSIDANEQFIAVLGGPGSSSRSKLLMYDLITRQSIEAQTHEIIGNPHDVAINGDGQVIVANLNPAQVWIFQEQGAQPRQGKAEDILYQEEPKAIIMETLNQDLMKNGPHLWKSFGLLLVFTTGITIIIFYISKLT